MLGSRDLALLRGLFECRVMASRHVAELYFGGHREMAKKRLQRLKAAGLVASRSAATFAKANIFLARGGIDALASTGMLHGLPKLRGSSLRRRTTVSDLTLRHELAVMDVRAAFHRAAAGAGIEVQEFGTWPALIQFKSDSGLIKPDAFMRIRDRAGLDHSFYLEIDRSTKPLNALVKQVRGYRACRKATSCLAAHSWQEGAREHRFTVLYVLQSDARLANFARKLLSATPPVRSLVRLATKEALDRDPLGAIWLRPRDIASSAPRSSLLDGI